MNNSTKTTIIAIVIILLCIISFCIPAQYAIYKLFLVIIQLILLGFQFAIARTK